MNDNTFKGHTPRQGVDHLPGQLDLIDHAREGAPPKPFEDLGANVLVLPVSTSHDLPVNRVLQQAHDADLETCIVIGFDKNGEEYFESSIADGAEVNWCLDRAKLKLLSMVKSDPVGEITEPPTKA